MSEGTAGYPYLRTHVPGHPRGTRGYVKDHVLVVEKVTGRPLAGCHPVHHVNGDGKDNRHENLVVCESQAYHRLLHYRQRIVRSGGNPNTDALCTWCGALPKGFFYMRSDLPDTPRSQCKQCRSRYAADLYRSKNAVTHIEESAT